MMEANGFAARLDELRRRADEADRIRREQWNVINGQGKELTGVDRDIKSIKDDLSELKKDFGEQFQWVRRGMWVAAGTFMTFILMLAGVLAAVVS
jgi:hypothetical protein